MQMDWIEDRMTWLGEDGMPKPISGENCDNNFEKNKLTSGMRAKRGC